MQFVQIMIDRILPFRREACQTSSYCGTVYAWYTTYWLVENNYQKQYLNIILKYL